VTHERELLMFALGYLLEVEEKIYKLIRGMSVNKLLMQLKKIQ
jgi:hypothetical protein